MIQRWTCTTCGTYHSHAPEGDDICPDCGDTLMPVIDTPPTTVRSVRFPAEILQRAKQVGHPRGVNGVVIEAVTAWLDQRDGAIYDTGEQHALDALAHTLAELRRTGRL